MSQNAKIAFNFLLDFSSIGDTSRIVQDSGELTKAWPTCAVNRVFQNDRHKSGWAEALHQG